MRHTVCRAGLSLHPALPGVCRAALQQCSHIPRAASTLAPLGSTANLCPLCRAPQAGQVFSLPALLCECKKKWSLMLSSLQRDQMIILLEGHPSWERLLSPCTWYGCVQQQLMPAQTAALSCWTWGAEGSSRELVTLVAQDFQLLAHLNKTRLNMNRFALLMEEKQPNDSWFFPPLSLSLGLHEKEKGREKKSLLYQFLSHLFLG